jgi:hypothetical protein
MRIWPKTAQCRELTLRTRKFLSALVISMALLPAQSFAASQTGAPGEGGLIHWKSLEMAQLRLDDKAPLGWNVFQPDKKDKKEKKDSNLVLVLLGHRYLMLDIKARIVYLVPLSELHARGADFESGDLAQPNRVIPSGEWTDRDVGPAELIRLTLGDYGRVLEVSLPHMPDMRPFY